MRFDPWGYQTYCIDRMVEDKKLGLMLEMGLGRARRLLP